MVDTDWNVEMITAILFVVGGLVFGSVVGWLCIRIGQRDARPFNWRVFIGPWLYYPWLDKWEEKNNGKDR